MAYSLIFSTVGLVGARKMVWGLAIVLILTLSFVTTSSCGDTRGFFFNKRSCLFEGTLTLNVAKK